VKKLFSTLFVAGLLLTGVVGCGGTVTSTPTKTGTGGDKVKDAEKAVDAAKAALKTAEEALEKKKDDAELKKAVDTAKAALTKAEDALKEAKK